MVHFLVGLDVLRFRTTGLRRLLFGFRQGGWLRPLFRGDCQFKVESLKGMGQWGLQQGF
jgi:hypothetical protein